MEEVVDVRGRAEYRISSSRGSRGCSPPEAVAILAFTMHQSPPESIHTVVCRAAQEAGT